jgi:multidrug efflux system membrane fusion protein
MVTVARPTERMVTRYEFATGRTAPLEQVEIRARVSGYLKSIRFQPGREVTKGAPLFLIDPEPFEAELAKAKAALETAEADLKSAEADQLRAEAKRDTTKKSYDREEESLKKGVGSPQTRDIAKGMYDEAAAATLSAKAKVILSKAKIDESKASYRSAELNLGYCTIDAPISGIVGDQLVTEGNLVTGGVGNTTLLTTIVAIDKMDVTFDVDESTKQRIEAAVRQGKIKELKAGEVPVEAGVSIHGTGYPLKGVIVFQDNRVDEKTGTIRLKARFDNPKPPTGQRLLAAGMYTRVRVPIGEPVLSMLVQDAAFGSDQGIRFLYLVGPDNKATRWNANTGNLEEGVRVVESVEIPGREKPRPLTRDDRIIVTGIQRVRPGMTVEPKPAAK